jgi:hypothetical protein
MIKSRNMPRFYEEDEKVHDDECILTIKTMSGDLYHVIAHLQDNIASLKDLMSDELEAYPEEQKYLVESSYYELNDHMRIQRLAPEHHTLDVLIGHSYGDPNTIPMRWRCCGRYCRSYRERNAQSIANRERIPSLTLGEGFPEEQIQYLGEWFHMAKHLEIIDMSLAHHKIDDIMRVLIGVFHTLPDCHLIMLRNSDRVRVDPIILHELVRVVRHRFEVHGRQCLICLPSDTEWTHESLTEEWIHRYESQLESISL